MGDHGALPTAIVVAGGRSRRFGTDKLEADVAGTTLLRRCLDSLRPCTRRVVVVGPPRASLPADVVVVSEEPASSGPYAAVVRGLAELESDVEVVVVVAGDLLAPGPAVPALTAALADVEVDAAVGLDDAGRRQPLLAAFRVEALRRSTAGVDAVNRPAHALLDGLRVVEVAGLGSATRDVDTPADLP
jgi:molybdopterin-guanine dinucleotide biosynthesis protein A